MRSDMPFRRASARRTSYHSHSHSRRAGIMPYVWFVFVSLVWGGSFVLMKKGAVWFPPTAVGAWRLIGGAAILAIVWWRSSNSLLKKVTVPLGTTDLPRKDHPLERDSPLFQQAAVPGSLRRRDLAAMAFVV